VRPDLGIREAGRSHARDDRFRRTPNLTVPRRICRDGRTCDPRLEFVEIALAIVADESDRILRGDHRVFFASAVAQTTSTTISSFV
jgi:hypothetical protein